LEEKKEYHKRKRDGTPTQISVCDDKISVGTFPYGITPWPKCRSKEKGILGKEGERARTCWKSDVEEKKKRENLQLGFPTTLSIISREARRANKGCKKRSAVRKSLFGTRISSRRSRRRRRGWKENRGGRRLLYGQKEKSKNQIGSPGRWPRSGM